jgi:predicted DCC family thiol-disulfide oxidoreductase YuxK
LSSAEAFEGADDMRRAWLAVLAPDSSLTVSQWADRHRVLSSRPASEAGPHRTSRTPYMRGIMDALSPRYPVQRVVFMKTAQVVATEAGNNWIGFCIHRAPGPFLAVQPTVEMAKRLSLQRIDPLIEESPDLRALIMPSRSRNAGNTILGKRFPGGQLILTGANSTVGLRSMPARRKLRQKSDRPHNADPDPLLRCTMKLHHETASDGFLTALFYLFFMENSHKTSVLFNATCPVCNFEITHYARYAVANDLPIRFDDLNSDALGQWGLDADTAARRLYVLHEGTLTSGIPAFLVLWAQMPRYRWLARIVGFPGIIQIASFTYDHLLAPAIYRWHLRRLRRRNAPART